jgi:hypothetical protein
MEQDGEIMWPGGFFSFIPLPAHTLSAHGLKVADYYCSISWWLMCRQQEKIQTAQSLLAQKASPSPPAPRRPRRISFGLVAAGEENYIYHIRGTSSSDILFLLCGWLSW